MITRRTAEAGPLRLLTIGCSAIALAAAVAAPTTAMADRSPEPVDSGVSPAVAATRPNIVYVMMDDLSSDVVPYMAEVQRLASIGVSFTNYFTSSSLCCPSRATFLTGRYPHGSGVRTNQWPTGGFGAYLEHGVADSIGNAIKSLPVPFGGLAYQTAYLGKYLNQYSPAGGTFPGGPRYGELFVPDGWDQVFISGGNYPQFDGTFTAGGPDGAHFVRTLRSEDDYLTDVLARRARGFIRGTAGQPFFLTIAPTSVHWAWPQKDPQYVADPALGPRRAATAFPAAPRHRPLLDPWPEAWAAPNLPLTGDCGVPCDQVEMPTAPPFNTMPGPLRPGWMPDEPLGLSGLAQIEHFWVARLQMAQAADELIGTVRRTLAEEGVLRDTYIIFGSDNGYHLGQHAVPSGKGTAYDYDTRIPFIIVPPAGVPHVDTVGAMVSNVDLYPTFLEIAGGGSVRDRDGRSVLPLLDGVDPGWRKMIYIHHGRGGEGPDDQDHPVPPYHALRTKDYLYVDWSQTGDDTPPTGTKLEFYRMTGNPPDAAQVRNLSGRPGGPTAGDLAVLEAVTRAFEICSGQDCWAAGRVDPLNP